LWLLWKMSIQIQVRRIATAILFRSGSKVVFDSGLVFNMSMSLREGAFSLIGTVNRTRLTRQSFQWAFHQSVGCSISMDNHLHGLSLHARYFRRINVAHLNTADNPLQPSRSHIFETSPPSNSAASAAKSLRSCSFRVRPLPS
jgi:hypothetical protein